MIGDGHQEIDVVRIFDQSLFGQLDGLLRIERRQLDHGGLLGKRQELALRIAFLQGQRQFGALKVVGLRGGESCERVFGIIQNLSGESRLLGPVGQVVRIGRLGSLQCARSEVPG